MLDKVEAIGKPSTPLDLPSTPLDLPSAQYGENITPPNLELKDFPKHLKCVFMRSITYPTIISSTLTKT